MREKDEFQIRREKRQKQLRKKRIKRTLIFIFVCMIAAIIILCLTVFFPIKKVNAAGSKLYTEKEITAVSKLSGKNLFTATAEKTANTLRKELPFVESVTLKRKFPDSITVTVKDAAEYCCFVAGGKFYSASRKGYILKEYTAEPTELIKVGCTDVKCKIGEKVVYKKQRESENVNNIIALLEEKGIKINSVDVSNPVSIKVKVCDRFEVNFGTSSDLEKKISHLNGMIKSIGEGRSGTINLSMWSAEKSEGSFTPNQ